MSIWNPTSSGPGSTRRRSQRVILSIAVTVCNEGGHRDAAFAEETRTLAVNANGALIALASKVEETQLLRLKNRGTKGEQGCRVMYIGPIYITLQPCSPFVPRFFNRSSCVSSTFEARAIKAPFAFTARVRVSSANAASRWPPSLQTVTAMLRITRWLRLRVDPGPLDVGFQIDINNQANRNVRFRPLACASHASPALALRSEERRVGKEGRSRWSP